jgi:exonuclease III
MCSTFCGKCNIRIPKNRPLLVCSMCLDYKHYKCNNLSKNDAYHILATDTKHNWTCQSCIYTIFPMGLVSDIDQPTPAEHKSSAIVRGPICNACDKLCSQSSWDLCNWCDQVCHKKCINNSLGCFSCSRNMIPGFSYHHYELYNDSLYKNSSIFNPYDLNFLSNQIGNHLDSEDGHEMNLMQEISEKLHNCNYVQFKDVKQANQNELKIMSLNIRSLKNGMLSLRDNISCYGKFDILCFNETNCDLATLPNGIDDLLLDGFYPPLIQKPYRESNKGGGLAYYINKRVCDDTNFELLNINLEHDTKLSCEHMFLKISLKTTNSTKSFIIGNLYRSPSSKPADFLQRFEQILAKLDRHKNKSIVLVGDFNIDLIKHDTDKHGQELVNLTTSQGFLQVISRPTRVTDHSATLIDHIFVNKIHDIYSSGIITCDISDHLCTYVNIALNENLNYNISQSSTGFAKFTEANTQKFRELINNETWESVYRDIGNQVLNQSTPNS